MFLYDPKYFPIYLYLTPASVILHSIFKRISPLIVFLLYFVTYILLVLVLVTYRYHGGGEDFEFVVISFGQMLMGIFWIAVSICFVNFQWAKKYWWLIGLLIAGGLYITILTWSGNTN